MDVLIPNLGDIDEVEVTELCVSVGDLVGENDPIIVIESDKASMEVPAGVTGVLQSFAIRLFYFLVLQNQVHQFFSCYLQVMQFSFV